jgi:FtsZ-binding cell division protein ZapB
VKTLYLHIGTTKTGTSSIQEFLQENREALTRQGYCFPKAQRKYPHTCSNRNAHFLTADYFLEDGSHNTDLEKEVLLEGMSHLLQCFEQFDNIILSEEAIWRVSARTRKELFPYLLEHSQKNGYTVKIVVYLRRQDAYIISNWNQCIKHCTSPHRTATLEDRVEQIIRKEKYVVNYAKRLDEISGFFGKENLIVRRYEPDSWYHGSIIEDFLHAIGIELTEDFLPPARMVNLSLQGNTIEIQRIINKDDTLTTNECVYFGKNLRRLAPESGQRYPCSMLSREETENLLKKFKTGNSRVAKEYIGDGKPLFSEEISDLPKWQPDNPYMTEDIIRFFAAVTIDLHRENEQLREETKQLRQETKQLLRENEHLRQDVSSLRKDLRTFKDKLKHPVRTLFHMLFRRHK